MSKNRIKTIALWGLQILFALLMISAGYAKFTVDHWVELFDTWGYFDGFVYVIGVLELLGGIGLLIPRTAGYAAAMLAIIMAGATVTRILEGAGAVTLIVHLVYVAVYTFFGLRTTSRTATKIYLTTLSRVLQGFLPLALVLTSWPSMRRQKLIAV